MIEIEAVTVESTVGGREWTYVLKVEGEDIKIKADRSQTLDELKEKINERYV